MRTLIILGPLFFLLAGCTSYVTPGGKAELAGLAPASIEEGFAAEPTDPFPASVVAVRVQAPDYSSYSLQRGAEIYGDGLYSIITTREVEDDSDFEQVMSLKGIEQVISLNRMLLPDRLTGLDPIRSAASRLRADLIFLYTFDTAFVDEDRARLLTTISLGFSPTRKITATTTVSALLIDTRTGFVYAAFEATEKDAMNASFWGSEDAADRARLETESRAFDALIDEVEATWPHLMRTVESRADEKGA